MLYIVTDVYKFLIVVLTMTSFDSYKSYRVDYNTTWLVLNRLNFKDGIQHSRTPLIHVDILAQYPHFTEMDAEDVYDALNEIAYDLSNHVITEDIARAHRILHVGDKAYLVNVPCCK